MGEIAIWMDIITCNTAVSASCSPTTILPTLRSSGPSGGIEKDFKLN